MKLYDLHMILQDKKENGDPSGLAYGISVELTPNLENCFKTLKIHVDSDDHVCCSAFIKELDIDTNAWRIIYAENYSSIIGGYYPDVKSYNTEYDIEKRMKKCIM